MRVKYNYIWFISKYFKCSLYLLNMGSAYLTNTLSNYEIRHCFL